MSFWKMLRYRLANLERVKSFEVYYTFKTEADMDLGIHSVPLEVTTKDALSNGYVGSGEYKNFGMFNKIGNELEGIFNKRAEGLLAETRKGSKIIQNAQGVWIQGKHVVAVEWDTSNLEWEKLTYEEYLQYKNGKND